MRYSISMLMSDRDYVIKEFIDAAIAAFRVRSNFENFSKLFGCAVTECLRKHALFSAIDRVNYHAIDLSRSD